MMLARPAPRLRGRAPTLAALAALLASLSLIPTAHAKGPQQAPGQQKQGKGKAKGSASAAPKADAGDHKGEGTYDQQIIFDNKLKPPTPAAVAKLCRQAAFKGNNAALCDSVSGAAAQAGGK